jgi:hypothetical protein
MTSKPDRPAPCAGPPWRLVVARRPLRGRCARRRRSRFRDLTGRAGHLFLRMSRRGRSGGDAGHEHRGNRSHADQLCSLEHRKTPFADSRILTAAKARSMSPIFRATPFNSSRFANGLTPSRTSLTRAGRMSKVEERMTAWARLKGTGGGPCRQRSSRQNQPLAAAPLASCGEPRGHQRKVPCEPYHTVPMLIALVLPSCKLRREVVR